MEGRDYPDDMLYRGHAASGSGDAGMPGAGTGKYPPCFALPGGLREI